MELSDFSASNCNLFEEGELFFMLLFLFLVLGIKAGPCSCQSHALPQSYTPFILF
jgi:hypothetical protein